MLEKSVMTFLMPFCYVASAPSKIKTHPHSRLERERNRKRGEMDKGSEGGKERVFKKTKCTVLLMKCRSCVFYHKKAKVGEVVTLTSDDISSLVIGCHSTAVCTPVSSTI